MITYKFNYPSLTRNEIDGKRNYLTPDGQKVPSVTTILSATKSEESKQGIANWRARVGAKQAAAITVEAASRGTRMHKFLELFIIDSVLPPPGTNPYSIQSHRMADNIIQQGLIHADEYWGTEVPVYHNGLYAGSTDCVGVWKKKESILDFKQSNKLKKVEYIGDYFIQTAAYAAAHNHIHGSNINQGVILICTQDYVYQEFVIEGAEFDYWTAEWWKRVDRFYY